MNKFIIKHILQPLASRWLLGIFILLIWTVAFVALPAISGWFLAACSVAFITSNVLFSYMIPSAVVRLLALLRTATRYFEKLQNHKTTLDAQQNLQLKIFQSVAKFPYFRKQVNNNSALLENSTHGVDKVLNHILLWILPLVTLMISISIYFIFLVIFSDGIALEFLISSAILLFALPQFIFIKNRKYYYQLKVQQEDNNLALIESFRGRIEISKYGLEEKVITQYNERLIGLGHAEDKLQINSFWLQLIVGFGFNAIALFLLWSSSNHHIDTSLAIGIFFGVMAQAELSEMLFSGKSEKSSVAHQIKDLDNIFKEGEQPIEEVTVRSALETLTLTNWSAKIPETSVETDELSLEIKKGEWIALFGETGKGKTTFLNSLFYPEYRLNGSLSWSTNESIVHLPIPECIYVTQKAYLLTATLRENFEGYSDQEIEFVLKIVDLTSWWKALPDGLNTWLGENGEMLSGGQRKKLLLAQALIKKPQLLVIDEPTAGISSENAISIFQNIKQQYPDITILLATHLNDFRDVVDHVIDL